MAQRKCEKCGSTVFVREGGYDVCQYCGAKYPAEDTSDTSAPGAAAPRTPVNVQISMNKNAKHTNGVYVSVNVRSDKSWTLTLILAIFFGYFGIHRFYVGKLATGALWFCTAGCFFVGWLGDIWKIAIGKFTDGDGRYILRK